MFVNVAKVDKLIRGRAKLIGVEGLAIALFDADGAFDALQDSCPLTAALSAGWIVGSVVECPGDRGQIFSADGRVSLATGRQKYQELQNIGE